MDLETEIKILQDNIRSLQKQLGQAHQRIGELVAEKSHSNEEVVKHKQFIQEISLQLKEKEIEATKKMQERIDGIAQVMDSKQKFIQD